MHFTLRSRVITKLNKLARALEQEAEASPVRAWEVYPDLKILGSLCAAIPAWADDMFLGYQDSWHPAFLLTWLNTRAGETGGKTACAGAIIAPQAI